MFTRSSSFDLTAFFPYQARQFYTAISDAVSDLYRDQYNMSPAEWRVMAALGQASDPTAQSVAALSAMDKVSVSRAIAKLRERGWIKEVENAEDRRSRFLGLTPEGQEVYEALVPQMRALEDALFEALTPSEKRRLEELMTRLTDRARALRAEDIAAE